MKRWKKIVATTALTGAGAVGGVGTAAYQLYTSADTSYKPDQVAQFNYDDTGTSPDKVIEAARRLHERINAGDKEADAKADFSFTLGNKLPHAVYKMPIYGVIADRLARQVEKGNNEVEIPGYGKLTVVGKDHMLNWLVADVVKNYNEKFPGAQVPVPRFIATAPRIPGQAAYEAQYDAFFIGENLLKDLSKSEMEAILTHEIRHKAQLFSPVPNAFNSQSVYSAAQQAKYMGIDVAADCKKAGLTDQDIKNALPSFDDPRLAFQAYGLSQNSGAEEIRLLKVNEMAKWISSPIGMLGNDSKVAADPQCAADVKKIRDAFPSTVYGNRINRFAESRKIELDADMAGAKATSPAAMAGGIVKTSETQGTSNVVKPENEVLFDHPSDETRLKALGCERITVQAVGKAPSFVARCEQDKKKQTAREPASILRG